MTDLIDPVTDETQLDADFVTLSAAAPGAYMIDLAADFSFTADPEAINLPSGVTLTIDGHGREVDGGNLHRGLFVYAGQVTIDNLVISDAAAIGGAGGRGHSGGGGGAGLGGGLFIAAAGDVSLSNVSLIGDIAVGGEGGDGFVSGAIGPNANGGGGGMGGAGGGGSVPEAYGGGGGGIGGGASGGNFAAGPGAGIIPGTAGGHASYGFPYSAGGATGGGGGTGLVAGGGGGIGATHAGGFGGGGGGGGAMPIDKSSDGAVGGFGGGSGGFDSPNGGGSIYGFATPGGFGGGGGGGNQAFYVGSGRVGGGRPGGLGGGSGGAGNNAGVAVSGGGGGGGLGAGGGIFVQEGGKLSVIGASFSGGVVTGGREGASEYFSATAEPGLAAGAGMFLQGNETITLAPGAGGTLTIADPIADDVGAFGRGGSGGLHISKGTVILTPSNDYTGRTSVDPGATLMLGEHDSAGSGTIALGGAGARLQYGNAAVFPILNTISLAAGASIELDNFYNIGKGATSNFPASITLDPAAHTLTVSETRIGSGVIFDIDQVFQLIPAVYVASSFHVSSVTPNDTLITYVPACFAAGTRIATPAEEIAVEHLAAGMRVLTVFGGVEEVLWVGHCRVDCRRHPRPERVMPVRVRADAFGEGLPLRELVLSPDHAVYVDGMLIPAATLINGETIVREDVDCVVYYHVELATHDVMFAQGLPAESYLDTGNRDVFANGGAARPLYPEFALHAHEAATCAPIVVTGARHAAVVELLRSRAVELATRREMTAIVNQS